MIDYFTNCQKEVPVKPHKPLRSHTYSFSPQVWDIMDQNCLLSIRPKAHKIRGDLQACHFSSLTRGLVVATDQISLLTLKLRSVGTFFQRLLRLRPVISSYNVLFKSQSRLSPCPSNYGRKQVAQEYRGRLLKRRSYDGRISGVATISMTTGPIAISNVLRAMSDRPTD